MTWYNTSIYSHIVLTATLLLGLTNQIAENFLSDLDHIVNVNEMRRVQRPGRAVLGPNCMKTLGLQPIC